MDATYPYPQPGGFHNWHRYTGLNYADLQNPSLNDSTNIGSGQVLFKFSNFPSPVSITVEMRDSGGLKPLGEGDIEARANDRDQFMLFQFPSNYPTKTCYFQIWIINKDPSRPDESCPVEVVVSFST